MKVIITGGGGFLGSQLCQKLLTRGKLTGPSGSAESIEEIVLLEQPYVKDDSVKISAMLSEMVAELGESIQISRFARFKIGESANADAKSDE